jgi:hypothetical protein
MRPRRNVSCSKAFNIRLVALNPYQKAGEPIDPNDYEATLVVTKNE